LATSELISFDPVSKLYVLAAEALDRIEFSKLEYEEARNHCRALVEKSVHDATGTTASTKHIDIGETIDEYLSAIFLEVRMMANYFRRGYGIFEETSESFARFD